MTPGALSIFTSLPSLEASGYQPFPWRQSTTRPGTAGLGRPSSPAGAGWVEPGGPHPEAARLGNSPSQVQAATPRRFNHPLAPGCQESPGSPEVAVQPTPSQPLRGRGRAWRMTLAEKLPALRRRRGPGGGPAPLGAAASGTQHRRLGRAGRSRPPVCTAGVRAPALRSSRPRPPLRRSARASGCPAPGAGIPPPARAPPAHEAPPPPRLPATPHLRRALGVLPGEGTGLRHFRAAGVGRPPTVLLRPQQALGSICAAVFWGTTPLVAHLPFRPAAAPKSRLIQLALALESWRLGLHSSQASLVLLLQ